MSSADFGHRAGETGKADFPALLARAGLRATRPRLLLAELLFTGPKRHLTAEMLYHEVCARSRKLSLATVYNTLHHFTEAGLLRQVAVDGQRSWFDTNTEAHHHFYHEESGMLEDCPAGTADFANLPQLPPGTRLVGVDTVIRVRKN